MKLRTIDRPSFILVNELRPARQLLKELQADVLAKTRIAPQVLDDMLRIQRMHIDDIDGRMADIRQISPATQASRQSLKLHGEVRELRSLIVAALIALMRIGDMKLNIIADRIEDGAI